MAPQRRQTALYWPTSDLASTPRPGLSVVISAQAECGGSALQKICTSRAGFAFRAYLGNSRIQGPKNRVLRLKKYVK